MSLHILISRLENRRILTFNISFPITWGFYPVHNVVCNMALESPLRKAVIIESKCLFIYLFVYINIYI